jgi:hypothetical protein
MDPAQQAAYIQSQSAAALIEALGMMSENIQRQVLGQSMAYDHGAFLDVILRYGIHHNGVISFFQNGR